jgi:pentatricopeptide repeat protein
MRKPKLYDRALFSFERAEYVQRAEQAVDTVFSKYSFSLQTALERSFHRIMQFQEEEITRVYRKIAGATDYVLKPSIRESFDETSPDSKIPIPISLPALGLIRDTLLDYETFWAIRDSEFVPPFEDPPVFEKNDQIYMDLILYKIFNKKLNSEIGSAEKANASKLIKSMQELRSTTYLKDATHRLICHPFFFIAQNYKDPEVTRILDDVEIALLENGYPDTHYRRLVRETAPDAKILEKANERLLNIRSAREIRRRIDRNNGASHSLENYAVTGRDGTTLKDIVLSAKEALEYDLRKMPPLHAPLEEILGTVGKNSELTAGFIKYVEKYWTDTRVISTLSRMQNVDEVVKFFEQMMEKHVTYNPSSASVKQNASKIREDFKWLWFYGERRLHIEKKITELTAQISGRFQPRSPYTVFAVQDPKGKIIYYDYLNTLLNDNAQSTAENNPEQPLPGTETLENFLQAAKALQPSSLK